MEKSPEAFRTISEVADWLGVPTHVLRFWESRFSQVKPVKRAGGRRYYRPSDMALIGGIKRLLHDDGMTIRGVQKLLREQGVRHVAGLSPPLFEEEETGEVIDMPPLRPEEAPVTEEAAPEPVPEPEMAEAGDPPPAEALPVEAVPTEAEMAEVEAAEPDAPDPIAEPPAEPVEEPGLLGLMNAASDEPEPDAAPALPDTALPEPADMAEAPEPAVEEEAAPDAPLETVPEPVPAPPVIPETPDVPQTDPADDAPEFDDSPALAARLARLSGTDLGGHGPALRAAHDRLAALRQRLGG